jgi:hypothetical protein
VHESEYPRECKGYPLAFFYTSLTYRCAGKIDACVRLLSHCLAVM